MANCFRKGSSSLKDSILSQGGCLGGQFPSTLLAGPLVPWLGEAHLSVCPVHTPRPGFPWELFMVRGGSQSPRPGEPRWLTT